MLTKSFTSEMLSSLSHCFTLDSALCKSFSMFLSLSQIVSQIAAKSSWLRVIRLSIKAYSSYSDAVPSESKTNFDNYVSYELVRPSFMMSDAAFS